MAADNPVPPGFYFGDDLTVGDRWALGSVCITRDDIDRFAELAGDRFALHMDERFARDHGFRARVAHGLLGLAVIDGLKNRAAVRLAAIASLGWNWRFVAPIYADDRITAELRVIAIRPTHATTRLRLVLGIEARNQDGQVVQRGTTTLLMRRRPA